MLVCLRGKASPDQITRIRLFADSAGYCQNPGCTRQLFVDLGSGPIHVAEMAHIFAASNRGPRDNAELSEEERGDYGNLLLLCANCHTMIDKSPSDFPDMMIHGWKLLRAEKLAALFGAVHLHSRSAVRGSIEPIMNQNRFILEEYGPDAVVRGDPESNGAGIWTRKVLNKIVPNNQRMLSILDANIDHMVNGEQATLESFRQHIDDLMARHLEGIGGGRRYPTGMINMMIAR